MDEALRNIVPTYRIGNDGFNWWIGQVEGDASDEKNNKGVKVLTTKTSFTKSSSLVVIPALPLPPLYCDL